MNRRIDTAKIILQNLREKPLKWTELEKLTVKASPTFTTFKTSLDWLIKMGYVEKLSRGIYGITDKGSAFLAAI